MRGNLSVVAEEAISSSAQSCQQRHHLAEPLWFALMLREIMGVNAAKELKFTLDKLTEKERSERTCRAWTGGDSEAGASILAWLLNSDYGPQVLAYVMQDSLATWWRAHQRAERIARSFDQIDRS